MKLLTILDLCDQARHWATSAAEAGEQAMADEAWAAYDHLMKAADLYHANDGDGD